MDTDDIAVMDNTGRFNKFAWCDGYETHLRDQDGFYVIQNSDDEIIRMKLEELKVLRVLLDDLFLNHLPDEAESE